MEVDTERITDDEQMEEDGGAIGTGAGAGAGMASGDEDFPVGEGEEDGLVIDSDGDEMMGDEIQDDQEYEEAMDDENMEPLSTAQVESENIPVASPAITTTGSGQTNPPAPFTPTDTPPVVTPFPEPASTTTATSGGGGFFNDGFAPASASGSGSRPLESPPAPETEMTPVLPDQPTKDEEPPFNAETETESNTAQNAEALAAPSPKAEPVATTEEAIDVIQPHPAHHSQPTLSDTSADAMPAASATVSVPQGESTPASGQTDQPIASGSASKIPKDEEYLEGEGEEHDEGQEEGDEEEYVIDANSLPAIIVHLPHLGARSLFVPYVSDPGTLPVWLKDRQVELAEATLSDILAAIRADCVNDGLAKNGALVITEKQMDLKMHEDDVNLRSITFLDLILLHHDCGLPEPLQLYLTWEESRFITRFNAIQNELEAVNRRRSESAEVTADELDETHVDDGPTEEAKETLDVVPHPQSVPVALADHAKKVPAGPSPTVAHVDVAPEDEREEYEEEYDEEYAEEEVRSKADIDSEYNGDGKVQREDNFEEDRNRRKKERDVRAEYAASDEDDAELDTKDLRREHPNWADAMAKPTDAMHFDGPPTKRYFGHNEEAQRESASLKRQSDEKIEKHSNSAATPADQNDDGKEDGDDVEYEEEEQREDDDQASDEEGGAWDEDAGTVDETSRTDGQENSTTSQGDMTGGNVPVPVRVSKETAGLLRRSQREKLQKLRQEGLGEPQADAAAYGSALPTPAASAPQTVADAVDYDDESEDVPLDEVAILQRNRSVVQDIDGGASPAGSSYAFQPTTPSGLSTPMETSIDGSSLTPSELVGAHAVAQDALYGGQTPRPSVIPEEDEVTIDEKEELVNDLAERMREPEELAAPVDGVNTAGIVPDSGPSGDFDAQNGEDEGYDEDYSEDDAPLDEVALKEQYTGTATSIDGEGEDSGSLKFYPQGHPDADEGFYDQEGGEDDPGYASERTLDDDDATGQYDSVDPTEVQYEDTNAESPIASAEPTEDPDESAAAESPYTSVEPSELETPSMTINTTVSISTDDSGLLSSKRASEVDADDVSAEYKRARTDTD